MKNLESPNPSMIRLTKVIDSVLGWVIVALMGIAVLNVLWQVFTRFVLADPSSFTDELARYLLIWIGLLGAGYAAGMRMHLAIDLLPTKLSGRPRCYVGLLIEACVFLFALAVLVVGGTNLVALTLTLGQTSAALHVPIGYVYLALPMSGLLMMFYAVRAAVGHRVELREWEARGGRGGEAH